MSAPSRKITDAVDERDQRRCIRCGRSLERVSGSRHHRMRRRDGGHSVSQLVLLCGSGTTGCHGWAHANVAEAKAVGLIIPALHKPEIDPTQIPVKTFANGWVLLHDEILDGTAFAERIPETLALELLSVFGMLPPPPGLVVDPDNENFAVLGAGGLGVAVRIGAVGTPVAEMASAPIIGYADRDSFRMDKEDDA